MIETHSLSVDQQDASHRSFLSDVIRGLSASHKQLDPKYFYDKTGSMLFEQITALPEYYITRTETGIMHDAAVDISNRCDGIRTIVEFGSGSGTRSQILLGALTDAEVYVPIDVSGELLEHTADDVHAARPDIRVVPVIGDFTAEMHVPGGLPKEWLGYFPGSTIGNFLPMAAAQFLTRARRLLGRSAQMLIGVDLLKSAGRLERAYNDAQGVTDAFNKNVLARINCELNGNFDVRQFAHRAVFNTGLSRIEMHLVSLVDQRVEIGRNFEVGFRAGETIHTENSHKYTLDGFASLARQAGWSPAACWTDANEDFSVHLLHAESDAGN